MSIGVILVAALFVRIFFIALNLQVFPLFARITAPIVGGSVLLHQGRIAIGSISDGRYFLVQRMESRL